MRLSDKAGCEVTRGATGRTTRFLTTEHNEQEQLVRQWMSCTSATELLQHPIASSFCNLIGDTPVIRDHVLVLFRGRFKVPGMHPRPEPKHFGPPRADRTPAGRYNRAGEPVLYLSTSPEGVWFEMVPGKEHAVSLLCQEFRLGVNHLIIADFSHPSLDNLIQIVFDYAEYGMRGGGIDKDDYAFSQAVADLVKANGFDGMVVPGVRAASPEHRYKNVVIFDPRPWKQWVENQLSPECIDNLMGQT